MKNQPINPQLFLHTFSPQFTHYSSYLLQTFKQFYKETLIQDIYFTSRCFNLIHNQRVTQIELFGCGFKKIYHRKNISPYLNLQKIVLVSVIDQQNFQELKQVQYLFPQIYLITLQTTNSSAAQVLKTSQLRKSLRSIKQINLNFFTFLDGVHYINKMEKSYLFKTEQQRKLPYNYQRPEKNKRLSAYRSFLLSYPKFYEYELHYLKTNDQSYNKLVEQIQKQLSQSLSIIQKHEGECKNFDKISSPKIKCLILNRQIINDIISPLIYGYYYGPSCQQYINRSKLIQGADKLSNKGRMYNILFQNDFDQSAQYIQKLANDKTALQGAFQTNYFYKAKHVIVSYQDPSPIQLSLHISCWRQTRQYAESRVQIAVLQQDIANRIDQYGRKVSNGNSISKIKDWILETPQNQGSKITQDQLIKLGMLTQITGDLWFFHHNSIKKLLNDEFHKTKYQNFISRRSFIPTHGLKEKFQPDQEDRSQLYRHEPKLIPICQKWIKSTLGLQDKQKNEIIQNVEIEFDKKCINNDIMRNRESKLVLLIDGIVGYNELAILKRMIKNITNKQITILAQSFCNTQQYADYLARPVKSNIQKIIKK